MRILFILASAAAGGAETLVRHLAAELTARGHACHVALLTHAAAVGNPAEFEREFLAELDSTGVGHTILAGRSRAFVGSALKLRRAARTFAPDIVHSHVARGLASVALARLRRPTIYTHHSVTANFPHLMFRLIDRAVDHYVAVSRACRDFLAAHVRLPIALIPNGVPTRFADSPPREAPAADPFILAVGTLRAPKDYPTLVAAARLLAPRLAAAGRQVRFAVAGEGEDRESLQRLIDESGFADRFTLLGARRDIAELMKSADLLVNSSVREGLPMALIEAAAAGLPAVVTEVGGSPEIVRHGESGYVVPPGQPEAMADAIFELLGDAARYSAFSARARSIAGGYSLAACADSHIALYERVCEQRSGRR